MVKTGGVAKFPTLVAVCEKRKLDIKAPIRTAVKGSNYIRYNVHGRVCKVSITTQNESNIFKIIPLQKMSTYFKEKEKYINS